MTAEVLSLPRGGAGRAPLVPPCVDVRTAKGCMFDIDYALSSPRLALMSNEVFGAWSRLQMRANREAHAGTLPDDDRSLAFMAGFAGRSAVDEWRAVKADVLEDWVLCSDGRWHHPERARNVLHIWIARRETDRKAAIGNGAKSARVKLTIREIEADIRTGAEALRSFDPRDQFLLNLDGRMSKWRVPDELIVVDGAADDRNSAALRAAETTSDGGPNKSEAKQSEKESSSPLRGDDSSDHQVETELDFGLERGSAERTTPSPAKRERAPPWPPDWFEIFQARFPKREAWGRAEKVLERIRKAGKIPFEEIMAGVDRLVARIARGELQLQFCPQPAKWLDGRGWQDEPDAQLVIIGRAEILPPARGSPGPSPSRSVGNPRAALATHILEVMHDATR